MVAVLPGSTTAEATAQELAVEFAADWGQPKDISKHGTDYWVSFETPWAERAVLGPRTVIVDGSTGKCRPQMRE